MQPSFPFPTRGRDVSMSDSVGRVSITSSRALASSLLCWPSHCVDLDAFTRHTIIEDFSNGRYNPRECTDLGHPMPPTSTATHP